MRIQAFSFVGSWCTLYSSPPSWFTLPNTLRIQTALEFNATCIPEGFQCHERLVCNSRALVRGLLCKSRKTHRESSSPVAPNGVTRYGKQRPAMARHRGYRVWNCTRDSHTESLPRAATGPQCLNAKCFRIQHYSFLLGRTASQKQKRNQCRRHVSVT